MSIERTYSGRMPEPNPRALLVYPPDRLFPLHSAKTEFGELAKRPLKAGWKTSWHSLEAMQLHMERDDGNVACRVGSGLLVVDVDPRNEADAQELGRFYERFGVNPADYLRAKTGGGEGDKRGLHIYMKTPPDFEGVSKHPDFPGIDFKSSGFVVAAGSVHGSGRFYELEGDKTCDTTAAAPGALLEALRKPPPKEWAADPENGFGAFAPELVAPALNALPVEEFRGDQAWKELAMSVHYMTAGEAVDIFLSWSARDPRYDGAGELNERRWRSFGDKPHGFTQATFFKALKDHNVPRELWPQLPLPAASDAFSGDLITVDELSLPEILPPVVRNGPIAKGLANCLVALKTLGITADQDVFKGRKRIGGHAIEAHAGPLADDAITALRALLLTEFDIEFAKDMVQDAAVTLCIHGRYDSLMQHVERLPTWDGVRRLHRFVPDYLRGEDTPLNRAIGLLLLWGMIRRARMPGFKFDYMPILEGPQGAGKSTAIRILAGDERYGEGPIFDLNEQRRAEALLGKWLYEAGELTGMSKRDVSNVKMIITQQADEVRMAYDRFPSANPRRAILVGTTNNDRYLRDATGNRRFLPVKVGTIALEGLRRDRDQLLAEAAAWDDARKAGPCVDEDGSEWGSDPVLPRQLWGAAAEQQGMRMEDDPWFDRLINLRGFPGHSANGPVERVSTDAVFAQLGVDGYRQNPSMAQRLRAVMERLGWTYSTHMMRIDGDQARGYFRPLAEAALDPDIAGLV